METYDDGQQERTDDDPIDVLRMAHYNPPPEEEKLTLEVMDGHGVEDDLLRIRVGAHDDVFTLLLDPEQAADLSSRLAVLTATMSTVAEPEGST